MDIDYRETLRYLGYKNQAADAAVLALVGQCWEELDRTASPRSFWREYPLTAAGDEIDAGVFKTKSGALGRNLRGCEKILVFAASLGAGVDLLLQRYEKLQMSKAVVMQAAAAAYLEDYCDSVNEELRQRYKAEGLYLRPRFSPGYGDFSLECQPAIVAALEAGKRVGITLTDSLLMAPSKSVTAVIGVGQKPLACGVKGCLACGKTDCEFRR